MAGGDLAAPQPLVRAGRNYHAHAKELSASVFKDNNAKTDVLAHRLHQGARMRGRPA
jgi:hypothetical protein